MNNKENQKCYKVAIQQNKIKRNQVTALHLMIGFLLILMGLVTWVVPSSIKTETFSFLDTVGILYALFGFCLIILSVFLNRSVIQKPASNQFLRIIEALVLLSIMVYTLLQKWYLPFGYSTAALLVIVFAYLWERDGQSVKYIEISEKGIFIPGFFKSHSLVWPDVSRVLLKHTILTVDCHDNHLYQFQVSDVVAEDAEEPLAVYSLRMIANHSHLPKSNW